MNHKCILFNIFFRVIVLFFIHTFCFGENTVQGREPVEDQTILTIEDSLIVLSMDSVKNKTDNLPIFVSDSLIHDSTQVAQSDTFLFRTVENNSFFIGEYLIFEIAYGPIKAGTAIMSIPDTQWVHGRPCYHIVTKAKSNEFFDVFYRVRDRVESWVDMKGLFTWRFEKHLREGKYKADRYERFDQINHVVYTKKDTIPVPPFIQDILTSFYYARTVSLDVGKHFNIENFGDGKVYPLKVLVLKKERIKVPAGKFDCIVIEPVLKGEGLFKQEGQLKIWLTDDERRIPVLMKSKIVVGSIDVRLKAIKNK